MSAVWTTRDGRRMLLCDMETSHLKNCISMMRGKGYVTAGELLDCLRYASTAPDGASMAAEEASLHMRPSAMLGQLEKELSKRGVST